MRQPGRDPDDSLPTNSERARKDTQWYVEMGLTPEHAAEWVRHTLPGNMFRLEHARTICEQTLRGMGLDGIITDDDQFKRCLSMAFEEATFLDKARSSLRKHMAFPDLVAREFLKFLATERERRLRFTDELILPPAHENALLAALSRYENNPDTRYRLEKWAMPRCLKQYGRLGQEEYLFFAAHYLNAGDQEIRDHHGE